jgi:hypothetical protein
VESEDTAAPEPIRSAAPTDMTDRKAGSAPETRPPGRAAASRRRRAKSRSRKRSAKISTLLENLGWLVLATAVGVPLLAGALYMMSR